jgi:hypothetical protein
VDGVDGELRSEYGVGKVDGELRAEFGVEQLV